MFSLLRQPFPLFERDRETLLLCLGTGLFVGLFLAVFQPFGTAAVTFSYKYLYLFGFGAVSGAVLLVHYFVAPVLFPSFFSEKTWTVGRNIGFILAHFLFIGVANYFYNNLFFESGHNHGIPGLAGMVASTFLLGIFPAAGFTLTRYIQQLKRYSSPPQPVPAPVPAETFTFVAENGRDTLTVTLGELRYIESADNYSEIVSVRDGQVRKDLLRSSLSRLEAQLHGDSVLRCHRSYIVNRGQVAKVTGNAQGYKLHLNGVEIPVPVARKYADVVMAPFRSS
ncbi:LytR/AlgR family response regulator transcription factor [Siphonobacter aquaeclarae]|uniref:Transcriptional regulator, LytTR family n=1 Tax=Siphonobacter aquaeclarae TaxID=563176 RepID=A0A1G9N8C1_9BACT|nr:LytTR family DNA-binding domain-containing protein [Siphonobacter aquaeclarae]SDL82674.1 transcriptional regulator, LytTR family [Siphonobacter aquaeclarae]